MEQMIQSYQKAQWLLRGRIDQLGQQLREQRLTDLERNELERRRRLLREECYEMEEVIAEIRGKWLEVSGRR